MRRKLTAVLLTAAMTVSLTACGGAGDSASTTGSDAAGVTEAGGSERGHKRTDNNA